MSTTAIFNFIVLGDMEIIDSNEFSRDPHSLLAYDIFTQTTIFYQMRFGGIYVIQKPDLSNFLKKDSIDRNRELFFSGYSALIFASRSFEYAQQLLKDQNKLDIFKSIAKNMTIYVITADENDLELIEEYQQLFEHYFVNYNGNPPFIFFKEATGKTVDIFDIIVKHHLIQYVRENHENDDQFYLFTLCAICRKKKEELRIHEDFIICNDCNPRDYNEEKLRAWIRLNGKR